MSTIGAKSFFFFEGDNPPDHYTIAEPEYFQHKDLQFPRKGITLLYGHRGPGNLIGAAARYASEHGKGIGLIEARVDVGEWNPDKARLDGFSGCRVLNLPARASKEVMDDVNEKWNRWLTLEGKPTERFPRSPSMNMHLLDKLIEEEPYNELNAIVYDGMTTFGLARFVTVYNLEAIDRDSLLVIPRNLTKVDFELPG
ncbi:MAG: hypothetical protein SWN10_24615 [Pseudomonadota bacterium]|nr:hypothetical protein [Pseudomonadota bacterium]